MKEEYKNVDGKEFYFVLMAIEETSQKDDLSSQTRNVLKPQFN